MAILLWILGLAIYICRRLTLGFEFLPGGLQLPCPIPLQKKAPPPPLANMVRGSCAMSGCELRSHSRKSLPASAGSPRIIQPTAAAGLAAWVNMLDRLQFELRQNKHAAHTKYRHNFLTFWAQAACIHSRRARSPRPHSADTQRHSSGFD